MPFILAGYTSRLPPELEQAECLVLAEGFEAYSDPGEIPRDLFAHQVAFVTRDQEQTQALATTAEGWRQRYGFPIHLEVVESRVPLMLRDIRSSLRALPEGDFLIRLPIVAFCASSESARTLAAFQLKECLTRKPWQLWL